MPDEYVEAIGKIAEIEKRKTEDPEMEIDLSLATSEEMSIFESGDYQTTVEKIEKITAKIMEKEQKGKTMFGYKQKEHETMEGVPGKNTDLAKDIYKRLMASGLKLDVPVKKIIGNIENAHAGAGHNIPKVSETQTKLPDSLHANIRKSIADLEGRIGRRAGILNKIEKTGKQNKEGNGGAPLIDQIEMLNNIINNVRSGNAGVEVLQDYKQKVQKIRKGAGESVAGDTAGTGTYMITVRNNKIKEAEEVLGMEAPL